MPVDIQQEIINRLQQQVGMLMGQITTKDVQIEVILQEKAQLEQIVTMLGEEVPPSQLQVRRPGDGSAADQDTGADSTGQEAGEAHPPRPSEPELPSDGPRNRQERRAAAKADSAH